MFLIIIEALSILQRQVKWIELARCLKVSSLIEKILTRDDLHWAKSRHKKQLTDFHKFLNGNPVLRSDPDEINSVWY
jgi:hypothetical protein